MGIIPGEQKGLLLRWGQKILMMGVIIWLFCTPLAVDTGPSTLPADGGVALTFDDDHIAAWVRLLDLLARYHARATFFVSGTENLTEEQLQMLKALESAGHEIGCHTAHHWNAVEYLKHHCISQYLENEILPALGNLTAAGLSVTSFAYPGGYRNQLLDNKLQPYFNVLRTVCERQRYRPVKHISTLDEIYTRRGAGVLVCGLGIDINQQVSLTDLRSGLERARRRGEILVLYAHKPDGNGEDWTIKEEYLESLLKMIQELGLQFYTMQQLGKS